MTGPGVLPPAHRSADKLALATVAAVGLHLGAWWLQHDEARLPLHLGHAGSQASLTVRTIDPGALPALAVAPSGLGAPRLTDAAEPPPHAAHADTTTPATGSGDDAYLPRSLLTQAPAAQAPVLLAYPDDMPPGRYRAVLTLFIDETGLVQQVRQRDGTLPEPLWTTARDAFLAAPFSPGQVAHTAVKSLFDVEVEFESTPAEGSRSVP